VTQLDYTTVKTVDFSQGIKSSEVTSNDFALQEQIQRERLAIAGPGVNFGLTLELTDFTLKVYEGTLVNTNGTEKYIQQKILEIEKPFLITKEERLYSTANGEIKLSEIPYSTDRTRPSQFTTSTNYGITAYYEDEPSTNLNISSINGYTLYTNAKSLTRAIIIKYNIAYSRFDTIYINSTDEIKIASSVSSTTPSKVIPNDSKYILGIIKIIPNSINEDDNTEYASCVVSEDYDNRRKVYTDSNNNLYLNGIPFESLMKIYFEEPDLPKNHMMHYNSLDNKLYIWRQTDSFIFQEIIDYTSLDPNNDQIITTNVGYLENQIKVYRNSIDNKVWVQFRPEQLELSTDLKDTEVGTIESNQFRIIPTLTAGEEIKYTINKYDGSYSWVPINDTSFVQANECKMWAPNSDGTNLVDYSNSIDSTDIENERPNHDLKNFLFKANELNLRFTPYKNELSIIVDQIPLHRDQFEEITIEKILNNAELLSLATTYYGYSNDYLQGLSNEYGNLGLGFNFVNALDRPGFIEVNVQHRVNDSTIKNKFQRSATFSKVESVSYDDNNISSTDSNEYIIETTIPYAMNENQLDVYVDGLLINKKYITEISAGENLLAALCKSFSIKINKANITASSEITYKITTNVYSYEHIKSYVEEEHQELVNEISDLRSQLDSLKIQVENLINKS
jgi:hypothetical protein